ncbi:MAG: transcriptional regulator, AraC family [Myxococcaceae bacterium]|nr:transcriptional regulator, AraC family [Myxococcaceae bacterium]
MHTLSLPFQPPYAWQAMLRFLEARALPGVELVAAGRYMRTVALEQTGARVHGAIAVEQESATTLALTVHGLPKKSLPTVVERVRRIFDLAADVAAIGAQLRRDPVLRPLVEKEPGLRVPGAWEGFELAVRGIIGQQITVVGATRLTGKLVAQHGAPLGLAVHEGLTHVFPSAARVAVADLSMLGMPGARRAALRMLADKAAADPSLFERGESLTESVRKLRALPGIGEWTAQYIALRALKEPDAFLAADVGLHRALTRPDGSRPTAKELLAMAEAWRPFRAYAALHLWTSLHHAPPPPRKPRADGS